MNKPFYLENNRFYLPQLDGLRFFAFFLVFVHHFLRVDKYFGDYPLLKAFLSKIQVFGWVGVDLFLVLSAFLITSLLLLEHQKKQRISLKDFYIRRTLRIWPLYYFMLLLGFVAQPLSRGEFLAEEHSKLLTEHLIPYLLFLGNYSSGFFNYPDSRYLAHLWTISLEEQFYILWPLLLTVLILNRRTLLIGLSLLVSISVWLRFYGVWASFEHPMLWTNLLTRLDPLAMGAILAVYRFNVPPDHRYDLPKFIAGILMVFSITFFPGIDSHSFHAVWQYAAVAMGFTLILDSSLSRSFWGTNVVLTTPQIVWLGKLCYGLYVYHLVGTNIGKKISRSLHLTPDIPSTWLLTLALSLLVTVLLAFLSYLLFEKQFLKMKNRFTHVESRPT